MQAQHLPISDEGIMSDPEWIALESLKDETSHFIFDDDMLLVLRNRGMAEPQGDRWRITAHGQQALKQRSL